MTGASPDELPPRPGRRPWPVLVPVAWAAVVFALMQPGAIAGRPGVHYGVLILVYDATDIAAFALRGANAADGRLPGRKDEPVRVMPDELAARLAEPPPELAERYYLEYPPAALLVFRLGFPVPPGLPAAVADAEQFPVAHLVPRTDEERRVWEPLGIAARVYVGLAAAGLVGLILVLARGYAPGRPPGPVWLAALPAAVYFGLNRFDVLPALATALAFACLGRGRAGWSGAWMAVGVLLKVYPVVFVPVILRHLGPTRRGGAWLAAFAGVLAAGFAASVAAVGWAGTVGPLALQLSRPPEVGWTAYDRLLPVALAHAGGVRLGLLAIAVLAVVATRPPDIDGVLRRCGLVLVLFAVLAVFWSPQWVLWFLPLVVPLAARDRRLIVVIVGLDVVNYLTFPVLCRVVWDGLDPAVQSAAADVLVWGRFGLWAVLAWLLLRGGRDAGRAGEPTWAT